MKIPEKTTGTTQPLDVYYFRQWKSVVRRFYDHLMLEDIAISSSDRDNILKMQSLIHNQFSHAQFRSMGHFAWYMAGLRPDSPGKFKNAAEILFPPGVINCSHANCDKSFFIRCSHCDASLCFTHFFLSFHAHFD